MRSIKPKEKSLWAQFGNIAYRIVAVVFAILLPIYLSSSLSVYGRVVLPHTFKNDIVKEAVKITDLDSLDRKQYIICRSAATTGYNCYIFQDENGNKPDDPYCLITGTNPFLELSYDFILVHNTFILYYTEKIPYDFDTIGTYEYVVDDWDVLYPIKRDNPFIIIPNYVLESDFK